MKKQIINALRWIGVLPASIFGGLLANGVAVLWSWLTTNYLGGRSILDDILQFGIAALATGIGFVWVGYSLAPSHKKKIALVLSVLLSVFCGISIAFSLFLYGFSWELSKTIVAGLITIAAAIGTYWQLPKEND